MQGLFIKKTIDENNKKIEKLFNPMQFTLNKEVAELQKENEALRARCNHNFENGQCIYCYTKE